MLVGGGGGGGEVPRGKVCLLGHVTQAIFVSDALVL